MTIFYADVSHYDWDRKGGNLDWSKMRESGMDIMIARSSYGDPAIYNPATRHFSDFVEAAKNEGFFTGGYHNLIHGDSASMNRQVDYFRRLLDEGDVNWAMLDVEPYEALRVNNLWPRLDDVFRFSEAWTNKEPKRILAFYIARWVWDGWLGRGSLVDLPGPLISARYVMGTKQGTPGELYQQSGADNGQGWQPYGGIVPLVWQFSSNAIVPGASPPNDVNAFKGTSEQFKAAVTRVDVTPVQDPEHDLPVTVSSPQRTEQRPQRTNTQVKSTKGYRK